MKFSGVARVADKGGNRLSVRARPVVGTSTSGLLSCSTNPPRRHMCIGTRTTGGSDCGGEGGTNTGQCEQGAELVAFLACNTTGNSHSEFYTNRQMMPFPV